MKTVSRICEYCKENFIVEMRYVRRGQGKYCNLKCSGAAHGEKVKGELNTHCSWCNKLYHKKPSTKKLSKSGLYFCSRKCKDEAQKIDGLKELHLPHYNNGSTNYRTKALREYLNECKRCGWKQVPKILQVHHIDENRSNNDITNLEILCPNCHAEHHWA